MALISCPECRRPISTAAQICPACGHPVQHALAAGAPMMPSNAECTLYKTNMSFFRTAPHVVALLILLTPLFGISLLFMLYIWIYCWTATLIITNRRTIVRYGILSKTTSEIFHSDVRNIQVMQGPLQRLTGVGRIIISAASRPRIDAKGIPDPYKVQVLIDQHRDTLVH